MQLENVGSVGLQFSWQVSMCSLTGVAAAARTPRGAATVHSPRPASAGPLVIRVDDASSIRPSSALARNITSHNIAFYLNSYNVDLLVEEVVHVKHGGALCKILASS